jgi:hypothetical protein
MYIKSTQMLVFHFIFDLLWTDSGSSVNSVVLFGFRELKQIEKHGSHVFYAKLSLRLIKD